MSISIGALFSTKTPQFAQIFRQLSFYLPVILLSNVVCIVLLLYYLSAPPTRWPDIALAAVLCSFLLLQTSVVCGACSTLYERSRNLMHTIARYTTSSADVDVRKV